MCLINFDQFSIAIKTTHNGTSLNWWYGNVLIWNVVIMILVQDISLYWPAMCHKLHLEEKLESQSRSLNSLERNTAKIQKKNCRFFIRNFFVFFSEKEWKSNRGKIYQKKLWLPRLHSCVIYIFLASSEQLPNQACQLKSC